MPTEKEFLDCLYSLLSSGLLPQKYFQIFEHFYKAYKTAVLSYTSQEKTLSLFSTFLELLQKQLEKPFVFSPYHQKIRTPFDHYQFGLNFLRPLVDQEHSVVKGLKKVQEMEEFLKKKENILLLANHQTESDPQVIALLLENSFPDFASRIIFVAGERVISDPLAVPFSMGCDLLCIYSKRYIDNPLEEKSHKQLHNKKTMELMSRLLSEGGKIIYVAPSGGRDRPNEKGIVEVAPFDPQSTEMIFLMAKKAQRPSHFYPLSLATYTLLPPPQTIQKEMGEMRITKRAAIHMAFGDEIDVENLPGKEEKNKEERRKKRADYIYSLVKQNYEKLIEQ